MKQHFLLQWMTLSSTLTSTVSSSQHITYSVAVDYAIYGQGSALDVAHKVTIINVSHHTYVVYGARGVAKLLTKIILF